MNTKPVLTLKEAQQMLSAAEDEARKNSLNVAIAIVDDGGHLLCFSRMDDTASISAYIAPNKAKTAALGIRESRIYEDMINNGRYAVLSIPQIEGLLEGGVPVMVKEQCVGAIGVSGAKSHEDVIIAKAGIAAIMK